MYVVFDWTGCAIACLLTREDADAYASTQHDAYVSYYPNLQDPNAPWVAA